MSFLTGERRISKQIIVLLTFNFYIKRTNECRQHKRKDRNIWHQHRVSRKVWFSHTFFLFTPPPPPHSQKQKASKESTSNGWNGWFDEASSTANWRTKNAVSVRCWRRRTSNVSLTPDGTILQNSDDFLSKNIPSSLKLNRRTFFVAENVLRFPNGGIYGHDDFLAVNDNNDSNNF